MTFGLFSILTAYVGPGAGLGLIGALLAVAGAVFAALFFVVLWPVRMVLRKARARVGDAHRPPLDHRPVA
ncbi:MAG TPA: hypothetical protein VF170_05750 [Planctomycetaceae bacterium]